MMHIDLRGMTTPEKFVINESLLDERTTVGASKAGAEAVNFLADKYRLSQAEVVDRVMFWLAQADPEQVGWPILNTAPRSITKEFAVFVLKKLAEMDEQWQMMIEPNKRRQPEEHDKGGGKSSARRA